MLCFCFDLIQCSVFSFFLSSSTKACYEFNVFDGERLRTFPHPNAANFLFEKPLNGATRFLWTASTDGSIKCFSLTKGTCVRLLKSDVGRISTIAYFPPRSELLVVGAKGMGAVYNCDNYVQVDEMLLQCQTPLCCCLSGSASDTRAYDHF